MKRALAIFLAAFVAGFAGATAADAVAAPYLHVADAHKASIAYAKRIGCPSTWYLCSTGAEHSSPTYPGECARWAYYAVSCQVFEQGVAANGNGTYSLWHCRYWVMSKTSSSYSGVASSYSGWIGCTGKIV